MINGVMHIVAAVLFAVVYLSTDMGRIWLWIAGAYLAIGVLDLVVYAIKNKRKLKAARKQAEQNAAKPAVPVVQPELPQLKDDSITEVNNG